MCGGEGGREGPGFVCALLDGMDGINGINGSREGGEWDVSSDLILVCVQH